MLKQGFLLIVGSISDKIQKVHGNEGGVPLAAAVAFLKAMLCQ